MKRIKIYLLMLLAALTVGSCGSDNDGPGGGDNGETGGGSGIVNTNKNINVVTPGMPDEITRLEFPKVKGGTSTIIVHETDQYGVNFCTEFDTSKKSQRWSCYAVYKSNNLKGWKRDNWKNNHPYWDGKTWNGNPFQLDPQLPANVQPGVHEFSSSSMPSEGITYFQRGHIVASEDRICSMDVNGQTFYMTNMQPQRGEFNTGIWEKNGRKNQKLSDIQYEQASCACQ